MLAKLIVAMQVWHDSQRNRAKLRRKVPGSIQCNKIFRTMS